MTPLVSVIMPAYNVEKYIQQSIDSVVAQSFPSWELIIVDDGSTDATVSIVRENQLKDGRIILVEQENKKQAAARNAGLKIAKGEWIAFLDADDMWMHNKLEVQLSFQDKADVLYTAGIIFSDKTGNRKPWQTEYGFFSGKDMYARLYTINSIPNQSVLMTRKWIENIGYQNESLDVVGCEDWEYWIRLAKNGATFFGIKESLFLYRIHSNSTSRNRIRMITAQIYAKYINFDFSLLNKKEAQQHFKKVGHWLIDRLLIGNEKDEALKQIAILNEVTQQKNYKLIQFFIERNRHINAKYLIYIAKPIFAMRALKELYKSKVKNVL